MGPGAGQSGKAPFIQRLLETRSAYQADATPQGHFSTPGELHQLGRGHWLVVLVGPDDLVPGLQQRVGPAGRQAAGDKDPGHPQWVV